jgi:hypothetical protein
MSSKKPKYLIPPEEIDRMVMQLNNPAEDGITNIYRLARAIEMETRERCAKVCVDVYNRAMAEWKDDGHRYNLGYAHGADECIYTMTGRTIID